MGCAACSVPPSPTVAQPRAAASEVAGEERAADCPPGAVVWRGYMASRADAWTPLPEGGAVSAEHGARYLVQACLREAGPRQYVGPYRVWSAPETRTCVRSNGAGCDRWVQRLDTRGALLLECRYEGALREVRTQTAPLACARAPEEDYAMASILVW